MKLTLCTIIRVAKRNASADTKLKQWTKTFEAENVLEPETSARYIIAHVLRRKTYSQLRRHERFGILPDQVEKKIDNLCKKRLLNFPVQYVIEEWDFGGLTLKMKPPVFIPRPETEELLNLTRHDINACDGDTFNLLEVGCGSGAISLALLHSYKSGIIKKTLKCTAIDKNIEAVNLSKENAKLVNLNHANLNIFHCDVESFQSNTSYDGIVSNPPYIPTKDLLELQPEIQKYESKLALHGGIDGLDVIRKILLKAEVLLKPKGWVWLEVDTTHPVAMCEPINSFQVEKVEMDFMNRNRFVKLSKPS